MVMRKLIDAYDVVASPGYLERRGAPMTPAELDGHDECITAESERTGA